MFCLARCLLRRLGFTRLLQPTRRKGKFGNVGWNGKKKKSLELRAEANNHWRKGGLVDATTWQENGHIDHCQR